MGSVFRITHPNYYNYFILSKTKTKTGEKQPTGHAGICGPHFSQNSPNDRNACEDQYYKTSAPSWIPFRVTPCAFSYRFTSMLIYSKIRNQISHSIHQLQSPIQNPSISSSIKPKKKDYCDVCGWDCSLRDREKKCADKVPIK